MRSGVRRFASFPALLPSLFVMPGASDDCELRAGTLTGIAWTRGS